jgi:hypothetical protein
MEKPKQSLPQKTSLKQKRTQKESTVNDPEMIVIPLEKVEQKPQARKRTKRSK